MKTDAINGKPTGHCSGCRETIPDPESNRSANCGRTVRNRAAPVPSLAQIQERAAIERLAWDEETYEKRLVGHDACRGHYTIPTVRSPVAFDANSDGES